MTKPSLLRRGFLGGLAGLAAGPALAQGVRRVTMLGDSITAGYGLNARDATPAQLEAELRRIGTAAKVTAAGVSGDTTAGGLARVSFSVKPDTEVCIVALGGNDLLQGQDVQAMIRNLSAIVAKLQARKIAVILAGVKAPPVIGAAYARDFNAAFAKVARESKVAAFYPDLLDGVQGVVALNQGDGIHPNRSGAAVIAKRLAPVVARVLKARR
jgi:acyl-CoA thioesterase-1